MSRLQLQSPGHYSPLEAFYEDKRALLPSSGDEVVTGCPANPLGATINHSMHPEMKVWRMFSRPQLTARTQIIVFLFFLNKCVCLCAWADHPPCRLHVPVHPLLRGADHGAMETGSSPQAHPNFLTSTCGCGLLQRWVYTFRQDAFISLQSFQLQADWVEFNEITSAYFTAPMLSSWSPLQDLGFKKKKKKSFTSDSSFIEKICQEAALLFFLAKEYLNKTNLNGSQAE